MSVKSFHNFLKGCQLDVSREYQYLTDDDEIADLYEKMSRYISRQIQEIIRMYILRNI